MAKLRTEPEQHAYDCRMELLYEQLRKKGDPFEGEGASTRNPARSALIGVICHSSNRSCGAADTPVPQVILWLREE
jgi:hypothetical protein